MISAFAINSLFRVPHLSFLALVLLISCKDEENINPLCGTWTLQAITTQNCKDQSQNRTVTFACASSACSKYSFSADGTLKLEHFSDAGISVKVGTYTISNSTIVTHLVDEQHAQIRTFNFNITEPNYLYLIEVFPPGTGKCSPTTVLKK